MNNASDAAANSFALVPLLLIAYSILCLLVPICVYRIMRRGTERYQALLRIEKLLAPQQAKATAALNAATTAEPAPGRGTILNLSPMDEPMLEGIKRPANW
jgi:hypothetical protein